MSYYSQLLRGLKKTDNPKPPQPGDGEAFFINALEREGILKKIDGSLYGSPRHVNYGDDHAPYSPGDWARILDAKNRFIANQSLDVWQPHPYASLYDAPGADLEAKKVAWRNQSGFYWGPAPSPWDHCVAWKKDYLFWRDMTNQEPRKALDFCQCAALYAYLTNDVVLAKLCRDFILQWYSVAYTEKPGNKWAWLDMNDTVQYPRNGTSNSTVAFHQFYFLHANFWFKYIQIYDLTRAVKENGVSIWSAVDQAKAEYTISGVLDYYVTMNEAVLGAQNWNPDGTYRAYDPNAYQVTNSLGAPWDGGKRISFVSENYSNRGINNAKVVAYAAIILNSQRGKNFAKRYWKALINYSVLPITLKNGRQSFALSDHHRGYSSAGQEEEQGYHYLSVQLGDLCMIADLFARTGDFELFDYQVDQAEMDFHYQGTMRNHYIYTGHDDYYACAGTGKYLYDIIKDHLGYWDKDSDIWAEGRTNRGIRIDGKFEKDYGGGLDTYHMLDFISFTPAAKYYKAKHGEDYIERVLTWHSSINHNWIPTPEMSYQGSGVYTGPSYGENALMPRYNWGGNYHETPGHSLIYFLPDAYNIYM